MQTNSIPVCHISYFNGDQEPFYANSLQDFDTDYPLLFRNFKTTFYLLLFVNSGRGCIQTDQHKFDVEQQQVFVIKPGTISVFSFDTVLQGYFVCFDENFFSMRYHNNVLRKFVILHLESLPLYSISSEVSLKISSVFQLMISEFNSDQKTKTAVLRSYLNIVLYELERSLNASASQNIYPVEAKSKRMFLFEELVEQRFKHSKTPSFYADLLNVSPNYLNKICKQERGVTAGEIIRRRVVIEAKRLLEYTLLNVNEISDELHFENASYFVTFFKKHTGLTPESYRKTKV